MQSPFMNVNRDLVLSEYLWEVTTIKDTHVQVYFVLGTTVNDVIRKLNELECVSGDKIVNVLRSNGYMKGYTDNKVIKRYNCQILGIDRDDRAVVRQNDNMQTHFHIDFDANWIESLWERIISYYSA